MIGLGKRSRDRADVWPDGQRQRFRFEWRWPFETVAVRAANRPEKLLTLNTYPGSALEVNAMVLQAGCAHAFRGLHRRSNGEV